MANFKSAQEYEDDALLAFNNGFHLKAINLLAKGAKVSLGRGRSGRLINWSELILKNSPKLVGVKIESFYELRKRINDE